MTVNNDDNDYKNLVSIAPLILFFVEVTMVNQLIQKNNKRSIEDETTKQIITATNDKIIQIIKVNQELEKQLTTEFDKYNVTKGKNTFIRLKESYDKINDIISSNNISNTVINVDKVKKLTDEVYSNGLTLLKHVIDINRQIDITKVKILSDENVELKAQLSTTTSDTLMKMINERISNNDKNLKLIKQKEDEVDEFVCQAGLCLDSIREIVLELPELINIKSSEEMEKVRVELGSRINFAERVLVEYKKQGLAT